MGFFTKKQNIDNIPAVNSSNKDDTIIASRNKYKNRRDFNGGSFKALKSVKIDGEKFDKKDFADMLSRISKSKKHSISVKDFQKHLQHSYGVVSSRDKKKLISWAKKYAEKNSKGQALSSSSSKPWIKEGKSARKVDAKSTLAGQKFISPKDNKGKLESSTESSFNRLGITSVKPGFQRGHGGSLNNLRSNRSGGVDQNKSQGIVSTGSSSITRNISGSVGGNAMNLNSRPRQGGL